MRSITASISAMSLPATMAMTSGAAEEGVGVDDTAESSDGAHHLLWLASGDEDVGPGAQGRSPHGNGPKKLAALLS
jgi:hypothetical protein